MIKNNPNKKGFEFWLVLVLVSFSILFGGYAKAEDCVTSWDCTDGWECLEKTETCVQRCEQESDCPQGLSCVEDVIITDIDDMGFPDTWLTKVCSPYCGIDDACSSGFNCVDNWCLGACSESPDACGSFFECVNKICVPKCVSDSDCLAGSVCYEEVCHPACDSESDCSLYGMTCANGMCIPACEDDSDCLGDFGCVAGACLDSTGTCPSDLGLEEVSGFCTSLCTPDEDDCPGNTLCAGGFCTPSCVDYRDCPGGFDCQSSVCIPGCEMGNEDPEDGVDCPDGFGFECIDDECVPTCEEDAECPYGVCDGGYCDTSRILMRVQKGHAQITGIPQFSTAIGVPKEGDEDIPGLSAGSDDEICSGNADVVLTLDDITNAHVSEYGYDHAVCLHSDISIPSVRCRISEEECDDGFLPIVRISGRHNAHVVPYYDESAMEDYFDEEYAGSEISFTDEYIKNKVMNTWLHVCCSVPADSDGDGFAPAPGEDCDDDDPNINPAAEEEENEDGSKVDENCNAIKEENVDSDGDGYFDGYWYVDGEDVGEKYQTIDQCPEESPPEDVPGEIAKHYSFIRNRSGCLLEVHGEGNLEGWSAHENAKAFVVRDPTAVVNRESFKTLMVYGGSGSVKYAVDLEPETVYTVSFRYKVYQGSHMSFSVGGSDLVEDQVLTENSWTSFHATFETGAGEPITAELVFALGGNGAVFFLDNLQLEQASEPTIFNLFETADVGCCPYDFCWTGGLIEDHPSCIHDDYYEEDVTAPPLGWEEFSVEEDFISSPSGYRCIDGSWTFSRAKFTPLYDSAGYCPEDSQCFLGADSDPACVGSGTYHPYGNPDSDSEEWYYCHEGNWTTRTKEIAMQMMENMADEDDTYTIFCDRYDRSLNPDQSFNMWRDYFGEDVSQALMSGELNEFCVMDLNGQVVGGVSLNNPDINDPVPVSMGLDQDEGEVAGRSFIQMLKGVHNAGYCDNTLPEEGDDPVDEYLLCSGEDVYYNPKLNIVLFAKPHDEPTDEHQAVPFVATESTFFDQMFDYLKEVLFDLLGIAGLAQPQTELAHQSELAFVKSAGSFDKLYISHDPEGPAGPRYIKAIRETRFNPEDPEDRYRTFISAEYHNYQVDICRFFYRHNYPQIRDQISGNDNIQCTPVILGDDSWMYSVYVEEPVFEDVPAEYHDLRVWSGNSDTFWNDITSSVRTQPAPSLEGSGLEAPGFSWTPEDPVVGTPVEFTMDAEQAEGMIARTWDFGDGEKASSAFNISTEHVYASTGSKDVTLWVMDSNYNIAKHTETFDVAVGPAVTIVRTDDSPGGSVDLDFMISGGHEPFNIYIDWGDGTSDQGSSDVDADASMDPDEVIFGLLEDEEEDEMKYFSASHTYDFGGSDVVKPEVFVRVVDAYGVEFTRLKALTVYEGSDDFVDMGLVGELDQAELEPQGVQGVIGD